MSEPGQGDPAHALVEAPVPAPAPVVPAEGTGRRVLRKIFVSPDGKVRAGWVLLLNAVAIFLINWPISWLLDSIVPEGNAIRHEDPLLQAVLSTVQLLVAVAAIWVAMRLGRQRFGDAFLADRRWLPRLGGGLLAGIGIVSLSALIALLAGELAFALAPSSAGEVSESAAKQLAMLIPQATLEEVAFRSLLLQQLARGFAGLTFVILGWFSIRNVARARLIGVLLAVGLTGILFGVAHLQNDNATLFGVANVALVGFVFGALTFRQGSFWSAVGIHIAWNACLAIFWGLPVSGYDFGLSVLEPTKIGDPLWTGGAFGPEASAVTSAVLALALLIVLFMPVREVANPGVTGPAVREA